MQIRLILIRLRKNSLFKDSFWSLLGNGVGRGLSLIAGIAVARFLGSEEYGVYGLIKGTLLSIAVFSSFGLGYTATKFIAENIKLNFTFIPKLHYYNTIITLLSSTIIAVVVALLSYPISIWLNNSTLVTILPWASIGIIFNAVITTQIGELAGFGAYKTIAKNNIVSGILTFACVTPASYYGGLNYALVALIVTLFFNCIINWYSLSKLLCNNKLIVFYKDWVLLKKIITFSTPIALQESLYSLTSWCGMAILIKLANYSELGIYSAATQWMAVILFIPGALRNVALSHLSQNNSNDSITNQITKKLIIINFWSTFIPFLLIVCFGPWIIKLYGSSYVKLPSVLSICVFTAVVMSISNVITQEFIAKGQNWYLFWTRFIRDVFSLGLGYLLIKSNWLNAASGFALAYLLTQFVYLILLVVKRKRLYNA